MYEESLVHELTLRGMAVARQVVFQVEYKGRRVGVGRVDLIVNRMLIVELKSVEAMTPLFTAQTLPYFKATGIRLGQLINFNVPVLKDGLKRVIF